MGVSEGAFLILIDGIKKALDLTGLRGAFRRTIGAWRFGGKRRPCRRRPRTMPAHRGGSILAAVYRRRRAKGAFRVDPWALPRLHSDRAAPDAQLTQTKYREAAQWLTGCLKTDQAVSSRFQPPEPPVC